MNLSFRFDYPKNQGLNRRDSFEIKVEWTFSQTLGTTVYLTAREKTKPHFNNVMILVMVDWPVADSTGVMQAVLGDMWLEMDRSAAGATLGADVRRLVLVDSLVWQKAALIWQKHLANGACFLMAQKREDKKNYQLHFIVAL